MSRLLTTDVERIDPTITRGVDVAKERRKKASPEERPEKLWYPYGGDRGIKLTPEQRGKNSARFAEKWQRQSIDFRDRLLFLVEVWAPEKHKADYLEYRTGIASTRWQNLFQEKQFPTLDMILAVCDINRSAAHWLLTGLEPAANGKEGKLSFEDAESPVDDEESAEMWKTYKALRESARARRDSLKQDREKLKRIKKGAS